VPPPLYIAASGPKSAELAGEIADGMIGVAPEPRVVEAFEHAGGAEKPRVAQLHVCWAASADDARSTALERWPQQAIPPSVLTELARPADFAALAELVTEDRIVEHVVHGPDPEPYLQAISRFAGAGYTHLYLHQIGPDQHGFFDFCARALLPRFQ
jgi:G6PDH family F420-dependent oxidoreductase